MDKNASKSKLTFYLKNYFLITGVLTNLILCIALLYGVKAFFYSGPTLAKATANVGRNIQNYPFIAPVGSALISLGNYFRVDDYFGHDFNPGYWPTVGPKKGTSYHEFVPELLWSNAIFVDSVTELTEAVRNAEPGRVIVVKDGDYDLVGNRIVISKQTPSLEKPVYLVAENIGKVNITLDTREGFYINKPHWHVIGFNFTGVCKLQSRCDHAFHIVGEGSEFYAAHNEFWDFNAAIKVNRLKGKYPDNGRLEYNYFSFTGPRQVRNSVTPINLDHGNNWRTSYNIIRDFAKTGGNRISYGLFFKGGLVGGEISNNLIFCNTKKEKPKSVLVGMSIGGGGMSTRNRRNNVDFEAKDVVVKNNIVLHCNDVALYVNKGKDSVIHNNTFYNTNGLDLRYPETSGKVFNNVLNGKIRLRDGGKGDVIDNFLIELDYWSGENKMQALYQAPERGDFTLINLDMLLQESSSLLSLSPDRSSSVDFCGHEMPKVRIAGAVQVNSRCFDTQE